MHILLVRFSSMGDVVLQTATINWLKSLMGPELRITFVTSTEFASLVDHHPGLSQVVTFDRKGGEKWRDLVKKIDQVDKENPIDLILDVHATLRSFLLRCSFWTTPSLTVDKRRWERFLLTKLRSYKARRLIAPDPVTPEPQVERIIKDFESIFGDQGGKWRTQAYRKGPHGELTSLPPVDGQMTFSRPYIVLAPGASFASKRWPIERYVEVARDVLQMSDHDVVVLAGPQDDFCRAFDAISSERLHNLQGKTSLKESMGILARAKACVGNDSGMNHIAEAHGVPCLTIFGSTDPRFGFAPHGEKSAFLSKNPWCKPCSTTGKKACFRDRLYCMEMISVEEVLNQTMKMVEG